MSTTGQFVRKMIQAFVQNDFSKFRDEAAEFIAEERRKNHHVLAQDLERILANGLGNGKTKPDMGFSVLAPANRQLPTDNERDAPLVEGVLPRRGFDSLVLTDSISNTLRGLIEQYRRQDLLRSYGLKPSTRILFCGPPGCGKTVAAEAVAMELHLPLFLVRFDAVVSSYLGETAANLRKVFDFSMTQPMVLLFDEFDAIGKHRMADDEHGEIKRVINSFLQMLDGYRGDAFMIAATNHQGLLDPALWRRFDEVVLFDLPKPKDIERMIEVNLCQFGWGERIKPRDVARRLSGMTHADVERICVESIKASILSDAVNVTREVLDDQIDRQQSRIAISSLQMVLECVKSKKQNSPKII